MRKLGMRKLGVLFLTVVMQTVCLAQTTVKGHWVDERGESIEYVSIGF